MTSTSFSQPATEKLFRNKGDSLVYLPKKVVQFMIQDIIRGDASRLEVSKLDSIIMRQDRQISYYDSVSTEWGRKRVAYESSIEEWRNIDATNAITIQRLGKEARSYKRKRNGWRIFGVFVSGLLIYHTNIK